MIEAACFRKQAKRRIFGLKVSSTFILIYVTHATLQVRLLYSESRHCVFHFYSTKAQLFPTPSWLGVGNIQDRFVRKRNPCCINLVKYKGCCIFRYILFHLHDGWAVYLFRLQGLKHRPIFSSTFLASYYCTVATGFNVQAFLRDVTLIFCYSFVTVSIYVCTQFSCNVPIKFTIRHPEPSYSSEKL